SAQQWSPAPRCGNLYGTGGWGLRDAVKSWELDMRVLLVEDEVRLAGAVRQGLEEEGFSVDIAYDGADGLWRAREGSYDAMCLDIMLPKMNGFRVCSALREAGDWTPILMLTAKD